MNSLFAVRDVCPVCSSRVNDTLFEAPYDDVRVRKHIQSHFRKQGGVLNFDLLIGQHFTLKKCSDCKLIYQKVVPIGDMLRVVYDEFISPAYVRRSQLQKLTLDNFEEVSRRLADLFRAIKREPKDTQFLDYGFGYGRWARVARAMGAEVYATELSPEKRAFAESIGVKITDDEELRARKFDIILAEQVLEHMPCPAATFRLLVDSLADGGVMKVSVPKQGRIEHLLKQHGWIDWAPYEFDFKRGMVDFSCVVPLEHVNAFRRSSFEYLARTCGLRMQVAGFGSRHVALDFSSRRAVMQGAKQWALRAAKDLYNGIGPGRTDASAYLFFPNNVRTQSANGDRP